MTLSPGACLLRIALLAALSFVSEVLTPFLSDSHPHPNARGNINPPSIQTAPREAERERERDRESKKN
jgi:hypothetical protein